MRTLVSSLLIFVSLSNVEASEPTLQAIKSGCRQTIMKRARMEAFAHITSPILENDRAEDLIDDPAAIIKNIQVMHDKKLMKAEISKAPWSDSYWPLDNGALGQRYNDPNFGNLSWKEAYEYVWANPAQTIVERGEFQTLSPSEKYDVLMELKNMQLTRANWNDGKEYFDSYGRVESWMGLCHGWAAASMMLPEPKKTVTIDAKFGKAVLYASDIKALATLLWAKGSFPTKFIGGRCDSKSPAGSRNNRPQETDCLDNNPGTWHQVVVNQIGLSKRPFIMDASYDYEVWNHPVFSFEYTYFNPKTKKEANDLKTAVIERAGWNDPKKKFRARNSRYVVGINMTVKYAVENQPSTDENQESEFNSMELVYDLELDEDMNIVGGEWMENAHPDFLWVPQKGAVPQTYGNANSIINFGLLSAEDKKFALMNAGRGLPSASVVNHLVKRSMR